MTFRPLDLIRMPLEGVSLIEASAGTGKTYTIANLFLRLILEKDLEVHQILVVTFTEAATKELRDRIRRNLNAALQELVNPGACGDETIAQITAAVSASKSVETSVHKLHRAVICFDEASIFTIHGFCKRVLDENAFESAIMFDTELVTDQRPVIREITDDFWRRHFAGTTCFFNALAVRHGLQYGRLTALAERLTSSPTLTIIPAAAAITPEELTRRHTDLKREWFKSKENLEALLRSEKSGFKKSGKPFHGGGLDGWLSKLNGACSDSPAPEDLGSIELFTTDHLTRRLKKGFDFPAHRFFDLCQAYCDAEREYNVWIQQYYAAYLKTELSRRKQDANIQFFDDLLATVHNALQADGQGSLARAIRRKFDAALIDEFQDTDPIQYEIFNTLFNRSDKRLFLIGDPKQSIYGFRGADIFAYIRAAKNIPDRQKYTLDENWRSESVFVEAANCFFSPAENPFVLGDKIVYNPVQAAAQSLGNRFPLTVAGDHPGNLVLWFINRKNSQADGGTPNKEQARQAASNAVVYEISRLLALAARGKATLGGRPIEPSDCAILVTRNKDAQLMKDRLAEFDIPAVISRAANIFKTDQAREVEQVLAAVSTPGDAVKLNTALATSLIGCPAADIRAWVEGESRSAEQEIHLERFAQYHDLWKSHGFIKMVRTFMLTYDVRRNLLRRPQGERELTNILHLAELIHAAVVENNLGINGVLNWIAAQRTSEEENEEQELRLERDDAAVQILTVFRSKGLQYPIVFCPFMWQADADPRGADIVFHEKDRLYLDIGTEQRKLAHKARANRENLSELVRLLYVAITRAQNRCYLTFGRIGTATALDYLLTGGAKPEEEIFTSLKSTIKGMDEDTLLESAGQHIAGCDNLINLAEPVLGAPVPYRPPAADDSSALTCRVFDRPASLSNDWKIASFSMLVSEKISGQPHPAAHRLKADEFTAGQIESQPAPANSFFAFPGGTLTGSCIHAVFENINFSEPAGAKNQLIIARLLQKYGLDDTAPPNDTALARTAIVQRMTANVVQTPLLPDSPDFTLGRIPGGHRVPELEFFYPVNRFTPGSLSAIFSEYAITADPDTTAFRKKIGRLEFRPVQGFMRGFIDLVFQYAGKYYLLDWKTNHLGNRYADYAPKILTESMARALYNLQYYIYTVALHKYLESRLPDYDYDRHFGGVFYLFVRGIHPDHPGCGVFHDRPSKGLVEALNDLFGL